MTAVLSKAAIESRGDRLLEFAISAPSASSRDVLNRQFTKLVEPLGAVGFVAGFLSQDQDGVEFPRSVGRMPGDWIKFYAVNKLQDDDPVLLSALRKRRNGYWSEHLEGQALARAQKVVMDAARQFRLEDGHCSLIRLDRGGVATMAVAGPELDRSPEARAMLEVGAGIFANRAATLIKWSPPSDRAPAALLTQRHLTVLRGRAHGKSNRELASEMGVRVNSVDNHVAAILRRLAAINMNDAIRIAMSRGLI